MGVLYNIDQKTSGKALDPHIFDDKEQTADEIIETSIKDANLEDISWADEWAKDVEPESDYGGDDPSMWGEPTITGTNRDIDPSLPSLPDDIFDSPRPTISGTNKDISGPRPSLPDDVFDSPKPDREEDSKSLSQSDIFYELLSDLSKDGIDIKSNSTIALIAEVMESKEGHEAISDYAEIVMAQRGIEEAMRKENENEQKEL